MAVKPLSVLVMTNSRLLLHVLFYFIDIPLEGTTSTDMDTNVPAAMSCPDPGSLENGNVSGDGVKHGTKKTFACQMGYYLKGPCERVCQANGTWSGTSSKCVEPDFEVCDDGFKYALLREASDWAGGLRACEHLGADTTLATPRPAAGFACINKLRQESGVTSWLRTGRYGPKGGSTLLSVKHSRFLSSAEKSKLWRNDMWKCFGIGNDELSYTEDPCINKRYPVCQRALYHFPPVLTCPELGDLENGHVSGDSLAYKTRKTFVCKRGYYLKGSKERFCQANGTWNGTSSSCLAAKFHSCSNGVKYAVLRVASDWVGGLRTCEELGFNRRLATPRLSAGFECINNLRGGIESLLRTGIYQNKDGGDLQAVKSSRLLSAGEKEDFWRNDLWKCYGIANNSNKFTEDPCLNKRYPVCQQGEERTGKRSSSNGSSSTIIFVSVALSLLAIVLLCRLFLHKRSKRQKYNRSTVHLRLQHEMHSRENATDSGISTDQNQHHEQQESRYEVPVDFPNQYSEIGPIPLATDPEHHYSNTSQTVPQRATERDDSRAYAVADLSRQDRPEQSDADLRDDYDHLEHATA